MRDKKRQEQPKKDPNLEWRPSDEADERTRHGSQTQIEHGDREGSPRREPEEPHRESEAV